jgi:glycosyltransferase involved in cell wall biosynthesis
MVSQKMISFIVPAHNEEAWIGRCLSAIYDAMKLVHEPYEVIVVDDASTDATAAIAQQQGARVIRVEHRMISATRNSGAREARGDILVFVDADTLVNALVLQSILRGIRKGAIGGGCVPKFDGRLPISWRLLYPLLPFGAHVLHLTGGACQFCTRDAFTAIGGFSEKHYAAEDALFCKMIKKHGRFYVPRERILTSGRSIRANSFWSMMSVLTRLLLHGPEGFRKREEWDMCTGPKEKSRSDFVSLISKNCAADSCFLWRNKNISKEMNAAETCFKQSFADACCHEPWVWGRPA